MRRRSVKGRLVPDPFQAREASFQELVHLQRAGQSRNGGRVRVQAQEEGAIDPLRLAVKTDGLADGQDVPLVERPFER